MNKLLTIATAMLLTAGTVAAKPVNPDSVSISVKLPNDSSKQLKADIIVLEGDDTVTAASATIPARLVNTADGEDFLLFDGKAYELQQLVDEFDNDSQIQTTEDIADETLRQIGTWGILGTLAICFGFPAIVLIVAIILIIGFLRRRNRERNAIIAQAIDKGYELPESFYTNQQARDLADEEAGATLTPKRDPQKFNSAVTLIAVGLCVAIFFWATEATFGIIAGGIPLLLGIGRLIGYFYIPDYSRPTTPGRDKFPPTGQHSNGNACPPPPPGDRFYYDPRDPRFNGKA